MTIGTDRRGVPVGQVIDGGMCLSSIGEIVARCWEEIPLHVAGVGLDALVMMPNHIRGILLIDRPVDREGTACRAPTREQFGKPVSGSLPTLVRSFKPRDDVAANPGRWGDDQLHLANPSRW